MDGTRSLVSGDTLMLYGIIDPWSFGGEEIIRAIDVIDSLLELAAQPTIKVRINSPGGSVIESIAIFNALKAVGKPISVQVDAMAASGASVVAMAGDEITMGEGSTMMIHDPWTFAMGGSEDFRRMADELDRQKGLLVDIYVKRTGKSADEVAAIMSAETFMSAQDAVDAGFADKVVEATRIAACALLPKDKLAALLGGASALLVRAQARTPAAPAAPEAREVPMPDPITPTPPGPAPAPVPLAAPTPVPPTPILPTQAVVAITPEQLQAAQVAERERASEITRGVRNASLPADLAERLIREGHSLADARGAIIDAVEVRDRNRAGGDTPEPGGGGSHISPTPGGDAVDKFIAGANAALLAKLKIDTPEQREAARQNEFYGLSLPELARASLDLRGVKNGRMGKMEMVGAAFQARNSGPGYHHSSDFGQVLGAAARRSVMRGYEEVEETFAVWTGTGTATDFRPIQRVDMGLFPALDKVEEGAEYKYGTIGDTDVTVIVSTYGKMFAITRQAIVNDDLGFFDRVPRRMGRAAKRTIGNLVYAVINGNPTMQDTVALFHATHANLATVAAVPSVTSIGVGEAAMSVQKDDEAIGTALGIVPKFILVPPALKMTTNTVVNSQFIPGDGAQVPNPIRGLVTVVSDPRLAGTAWYLAADPNQVDTIEVTYLDGVQEPFMDQREGWNVDGSEFKVRMDAGVKALHWRGLYKNAGV